MPHVLRREVPPSHRAPPARVHALLLAATLALAPSAPAYPIAPQTLWELTEGAELVVWAEVEDITDAPAENSGRDDLDAGSSRAHLRVREVWKGDVKSGERLQVAFDPDMICPAPDRYEKGLAVVAFLARGGSAWHTVGLSYGTRYPTSTGELEAYRRAVRGVEEAQRQRQDVAAARTAWQVLAAMHPATRWDGLYGLVSEADAEHAFYDPRARQPASLSPAQRVKLARGFVEHPPRGRDLPMMLAALRRHPSPDVDRAAASALETVLTASPAPGWAQLAFDLLRERHGEQPGARPAQDGDPLLRAFEDGASGPAGRKHPATEALRAAWKQFKRRHGLRPALLPLPAEAPVRGTGGDTPL